jgi:hypothetical protein
MVFGLKNVGAIKMAKSVIHIDKNEFRKQLIMSHIVIYEKMTNLMRKQL